MSAIDPTPQQVQSLIGASHLGPVVMTNLLAFDGPTGAESYARYAEGVQPHLERVGAQVLYVGAALQLVIGDGEQPWWDAIVVVQYPSVPAFLEMVGDPGYQAVHTHRAAALTRAELIATSPGVLEPVA